MVNMKKYLLFSSFFSLALLSGCSNEKEENVTGESSVMIDLSADLSYAKSRAIDESEYKNTQNYKVSLYKGEEPVFENTLYKDLNVMQQVESGVTYTLSAEYGEDVACGYDKLYVKGSTSFSVPQGETNKVSVECKPANAKFMVVYEGKDENDAFEDYFQDCTVSLKTQYMDEAFTMSKQDVDKELYLRTGDEGTEAVLSFSVIDKDGGVVTVEGFETEKTVVLKPAVAYTLTIKPTVVEVEGGKVGLDITVDDGVTEENVNITIPGDYLK